MRAGIIKKHERYDTSEENYIFLKLIVACINAIQTSDDWFCNNFATDVNLSSQPSAKFARLMGDTGAERDTNASTSHLRSQLQPVEMSVRDILILSKFVQLWQCLSWSSKKMN